MNEDRMKIAMKERGAMLAALAIAQSSKDPSTKVGAVLLPTTVFNGFLIEDAQFTGYNRFPKGIGETEERMNNRELKLSMIVHAEMNALLRAGPFARGSTLYISVPWSCSQCAKHIIEAGVVRVVVSSQPVPERWAESWELTKAMFAEAGVVVETL